MSIEASHWALNVPIGGNAKVILLGIANHADPDGTEAYPSLNTLARYAHCDRSTARRNVRRLIADGWLVEDGLGPRGQSKYRLPMEGLQNATGGTGATGGGGIAVPPEPSIEPSTSLSSQIRAEKTENSTLLLGEQLKDDQSCGREAETVSGEIVEAPRLRFNGRHVPRLVADDATAALAYFCERTGQNLKPLDGRGRPTESLKRIIGAMTAHPEVRTVYRRMIDHSLMAPWWEGEPTVGVVFGPRVVEASIQRAQRRPLPGSHMRLTPTGQALRALRLAGTAELG